MPFPRTEKRDAILGRFSRQRVLVLGDVMLDRYLWGDTTRISPEAPVPVIEALDETLRMGGAANVAHNVARLGARPVVVGVIGPDGFGHDLKSLMNGAGISPEWLVEVQGRRTSAKTRILARRQQVLRVDREETAEIDGSVLEMVLERAMAALDTATAVVISDYGKGVVTRALLAALLPVAIQREIPICVDPKETHFFAYRGVSVITPNTAEAGAAFGRRLRDDDDLIAAGRYLRDELECRAVLITRGSLGMTLFPEQGPVLHFPVTETEVFDVTGAGDTVVSVYALALASGADAAEAAAVSNHAAGLVIREVGTTTTTAEAIRAALDSPSGSPDPVELNSESVSVDGPCARETKRGLTP